MGHRHKIMCTQDVHPSYTCCLVQLAYQLTGVGQGCMNESCQLFMQTVVLSERVTSLEELTNKGNV